ncbi:MAG: hypothetical protein RL174_980 [Actinomycetota bacterium]|jgi:transcriptional regulator with XRE-family HTH domain
MTSKSLDDLIDKYGMDPEELERGAREMHIAVNAYKLREIREETGMTQVELAALMGVSQNRVSKIERGEINKTEIGTLRKYFAALNGDVLISVKIGGKIVPLIEGVRKRTPQNKKS